MTKEDEIILAAEDEFFANGYDACSTATIAKRAGVTHAMVNYYFRSKEKLFIQILDNHVYGLLKVLKPLMQEDGNVAEIAQKAALAIFDKMNEDRRFPYLLSDIARTHPDFLLRYKETFDSVCHDSLAMHSKRLESCISQGQVQQCHMSDIYNTVLTLAATPFLTIPVLENVAGLPAGQIDTWLQARKQEMVAILKARYSAS